MSTKGRESAAVLGASGISAAYLSRGLPPFSVRSCVPRCAVPSVLLGLAQRRGRTGLRSGELWSETNPAQEAPQPDGFFHWTLGHYGSFPPAPSLPCGTPTPPSPAPPSSPSPGRVRAPWRSPGLAPAIAQTRCRNGESEAAVFR